MEEIIKNTPYEDGHEEEYKKQVIYKFLSKCSNINSKNPDKLISIRFDSIILDFSELSIDINEFFKLCHRLTDLDINIIGKFTMNDLFEKVISKYVDIKDLEELCNKYQPKFEALGVTNFDNLFLLFDYSQYQEFDDTWMCQNLIQYALDEEIIPETLVEPLYDVSFNYDTEKIDMEVADLHFDDPEDKIAYENLKAGVNRFTELTGIEVNLLV
jgi:hypothetical protein